MGIPIIVRHIQMSAITLTRMESMIRLGRYKTSAMKDLSISSRLRLQKGWSLPQPTMEGATLRKGRTTKSNTEKAATSDDKKGKRQQNEIFSKHEKFFVDVLHYAKESSRPLHAIYTLKRILDTSSSCRNPNNYAFELSPAFRKYAPNSI